MPIRLATRGKFGNGPASIATWGKSGISKLISLIVELIKRQIFRKDTNRRVFILDNTRRVFTFDNSKREFTFDNNRRIFIFDDDRRMF